jgi:RHS repeat-associated protein
VREQSGVTTYYVHALGMLLYEDSTATGLHAYHCDVRGSTVALSDATAAISDRVSYGLYGETVARTGTTDTPFLYHGAWGVETDANGLLHMRARYYSVETRRFLNADPLGFGGGLNWYAFASGNPASLGDPAGEAASQLADQLNSYTGVSRDYYTSSGSSGWSVAWNTVWWTVSDLVDGTVADANIAKVPILQATWATS